MKKVAIVALAALALASVSMSSVFAQAGGPLVRAVIQLQEQNSSGQTGTATLEEVNGQLMVTINISGGTDTPQPAHIHKGTCANLDPAPAYPLTNVVNGASQSTVAVTMADVVNSPHAINVHKSGAEASVYVACGDIVNMAMGAGAGGAGEPIGAGGGPETTGVGTVGMPSTGSGDVALLLAALTALALTITGAGLKLARRKA